MGHPCACLACLPDCPPASSPALPRLLSLPALTSPCPACSRCLRSPAPAPIGCLQGTGDCLLTYENEAFFTNIVVPEKDRLPYIVPDNNIRVRGRLSGGSAQGGWLHLAGLMGWVGD